MCGIAGIWNYKSGQPADRPTLQAITRLLAHRGPDGEGFYWGPGPGLGHRRLSIIDLEGGHQPLSNEDGSVWVIFNGEIYNYPELRQELLERGHTLHTHSDTETIVHLYEDYGDGCLEKLRGMFALALWDNRRQKLLLARDRLGIKPLFYGLSREGIIFGSELKCIRESGQLELLIDSTAIADLFTCFYIPGPKTIYRDVYSLDPGHYLSVTPSGIVKAKYWDLQEDQLCLPTERDYEEQFYTILRESVGCHLLSDVPLGAFLSGGVDSSSIVAMMSSLVTGPVMTCSIGFDVEEYNELPRARTVAQLFATDHHEQVISPEPAKILEKLAHCYDQPFPDDSSIPTYYVSRLARKRVKVALSGDGGDENFAGYGRFPRHHLLERVRRSIPAPIQAVLRSTVGNWKDDREKWDVGTKIRRVLYQMTVGAREGYLHAMTIADAGLRSKIFSSDLQHELAGYDPLDVFRDIYNRAPGLDPLSRMFYLDLKTFLVDDILTKVDRASMANSLEVRVPLLDHKVVEFAFSLPIELKLRSGRGKYLLRKTMQRHLPASHLDLGKKGFVTPGEWLRGDLREWAREILFSNSQVRPFLDLKGVERIWNTFQQGGSHLVFVLNTLISFSLSTEIWMCSTPAVPSARSSAPVPHNTIGGY